MAETQPGNADGVQDGEAPMEGAAVPTEGATEPSVPAEKPATQQEGGEAVADTTADQDSAPAPAENHRTSSSRHHRTIRATG